MAALPPSRLVKSHETEGSHCPACDGGGFPVPCCCGGDIHRELVGPESARQAVMECDRCGYKYRYWPEVTPAPELPTEVTEEQRRAIDALWGPTKYLD